VYEAAWLLQETVNATKRLCRNGSLTHFQHGKRVQIPADSLREHLRSPRALRLLEEVARGAVIAPRPASASAQPAPLTESEA
jgi:hypothetical protein